MSYSNILVDVFNVYHKYKAVTNSDDMFDICRKVVDAVNSYKQRLDENGDIFLLFDPIPKSDLGESKVFRLTYRSQIYKDYKANRKYETEDLKAISFLRSYFKFRGEHIKTVISNMYEADDYVESLIAKLPKRIALISTDYDWARYISDDVDLINDGFDNPFNVQAFIEKFGFKPSIASLTIYKAVFGDASDNIQKLSTLKKVFYYGDIEKSCIEMLNSLNDEKLEDILHQILSYNVSDYMTSGEVTPIEKFSFILNSAEYKTKSPIPTEVFRTNIQLIRCICKDAWKYVHYCNENSAINKALDASVGIGIVKKKIVFGGIRI